MERDMPGLGDDDSRFEDTAGGPARRTCARRASRRRPPGLWRAIRLQTLATVLPAAAAAAAIGFGAAAAGAQDPARPATYRDTASARPATQSQDTAATPPGGTTGTTGPATPPATSASKSQPPVDLWRQYPLSTRPKGRSRPRQAGAPERAAHTAPSPEASTTTFGGIPQMALYGVLIFCAAGLLLLATAGVTRAARRGGGARRFANGWYRPVAVARAGLMAAESRETRSPAREATPPAPRASRETRSPAREATPPAPPASPYGVMTLRPGARPPGEEGDGLEQEPEVLDATRRIGEMQRAAADEAEHLLKSAHDESIELRRHAAADAERAEELLKVAQAQSIELRRRAAADAERAGEMLAEAERSADEVLATVRERAAALREFAEQEAMRRLIEEANAPRVRVRRFDLASVFAVVSREVLVFLRTWRSTTFAAIVEPTIFLLAFGLGIGALIKSVRGVDYIQFVGTGVVATTVVFSSAFPSMFQTFIKSRFQKLYDSILSTPVDVPELVTAEMLWTATRTGLYALAPLIVAVAFGLRPHWGVAVVPLIAFVTAFGFAGFGITIAAGAKAITSFNYIISGLLTPLLLVAGAYFPVDQLPPWAQALNNVNPLYHCVELVRDAVFGVNAGGSLVHLGALLLFGAVTWWFAVHRLRPRLID
jgi:lipooligosaccharide transport system permease protein